MTSQPGKQTIAMYILPNISRSKGNQTMKFGQLIEYNMINILFEKSYKNTGWGGIVKIEHISGSIAWSFTTICVYCMPRSVL